MTDTFLLESDEDGNLKYKKLKDFQETKPLSLELLEKVLLDPRRKMNILLTEYNKEAENEGSNVLGNNITIDVDSMPDRSNTVFKDEEGIFDGDNDNVSIAIAHELIHVLHASENYERFIDKKTGKFSEKDYIYYRVNEGYKPDNFVIVDVIGPQVGDRPRKTHKMVERAEEVYTTSSSNQQIKIYNLDGEPIDYPNKGNKKSITENSIRLEHGLPIRMNYSSISKKYTQDYKKTIMELLKNRNGKPIQDDD